MQRDPDRTPPRLLEQLRRAIRARQYSPRTAEAYAGWVRRYVLYHGKRHPGELDGRHVAGFLAHLANEGRVSASTQKQAADITIRDAIPADTAALARLHVQAFDETHGRGPDAALREQQWSAKFRDPGKLLFCVLLENARGRLIGFASGEPNSDSSAYAGVLDKIYLLREYHHRGLGRLLLCAAAERFRRHGITSMLLFGDARSPTNSFYEAMGGVRLYAMNGEFHGGYGWPDLHTVLERCRATISG